MRSATMGEATRRLARRELFLGGFTFLMAVIGLASLAAVAIAGTGAGLRVTGTDGGGSARGGEATLVVVGYGEAGVAAETATLQLLLGPSEYGGMTIVDGSTGGGETGDAGAPGDAQRGAAEPIAQAIREAGVAPGDVAVLVSPALETGYFGGEGSGYGVRLDVTVRGPTAASVGRVVDAAGAAAIADGMRLAQVGVAYAVADCAAVERLARERAIADARATAEQQAALLGTDLGVLLLASDDPEDAPEGAPSSADCGMPTGAGSASALVYGAGSGVTLPSFAPGQAAEATARIRVSMTFALPEG